MRFLRQLGLLLLALPAVNLAWRWASRRRSLPCPTWLAGFLESPLLDAFLGTTLVLDRLGLRPGQRVLEVGPGPGRLLIPAARRVLPGGAVVGLDIQLGMITRLRERAWRAGVDNLRGVVGDAAAAPFPPESFDLIYLCTVLGEIPDRGAALKQCHAALKKGAQLSITEIFPDPHYQWPAEARRRAEGAGFKRQAACGPWYFCPINFVK